VQHLPFRINRAVVAILVVLTRQNARAKVIM